MCLEFRVVLRNPDINERYSKVPPLRKKLTFSQQVLKVNCFEFNIPLFLPLSAQEARPEFLKRWFLKGGTLLHAFIRVMIL